MSESASQVSLRSPRANGPLVPAGPQVNAETISEEAIAARAYEKFVARGCVHGFDQEDWAAARFELMAQSSGRKK
jgi:hypothetical protein